MAIAELAKPTDEQVREYWRTYDEVTQAHRSGYHKPYCNLHSDEPLWGAYDLGFHDALKHIANNCAAQVQS